MVPTSSRGEARPSRFASQIRSSGGGNNGRRRGGFSTAREGLKRVGAGRGPKGVLRGEQTQCRFCRRGIKYVDYKDIDTLQKLLTNRGKIYSRKRSGNCAGCQRKVKKAIKRARYMALLPFTA